MGKLTKLLFSLTVMFWLAFAVDTMIRVARPEPLGPGLETFVFMIGMGCCLFSAVANELF
jgi:hypothetical protein